MITTEHNIIHWVESLDNESLVDYTPLKIHHYMELFKISDRKSMITADSVIFREDMKYAVFSTLEQRYYLRHTKLPLGGESVSETLKTLVKDKKVTLLLTAEDIQETDLSLRRLNKYYYKKEGKMDYRVYIRLMITILAKENFINFNRSSLGYRSGVAEYDRQIKQILTS